jgi:hypothetical protein
MSTDDNKFYKRHVFFRKPETLDWIIDRSASSPENDIISRLDGDEEEEPPLPSLDGISDDLVWIWRCREMGWGWKEIAPMIGLRTPAGAWKRFHRLVRECRKKHGLSIGDVDAQDAC